MAHARTPGKAKKANVKSSSCPGASTPRMGSTSNSCTAGGLSARRPLVLLDAMLLSSSCVEGRGGGRVRCCVQGCQPALMQGMLTGGRWEVGGSR